MPDTTSTLYRGGHVRTPDHPAATALLVRGGAVAWIGADDAAPGGSDDVEVVDLDGALVTPAFVDAHVHATSTGLALTGLDLTGSVSLADALKQVEAAGRKAARRRHCSATAGTRRPGPSTGAPTRQELDRASYGGVVYLSRIDVHSAVVSSALLAAVPEVRADGWVRRQRAPDARDGAPRRAPGGAGVDHARRSAGGSSRRPAPGRGARHRAAARARPARTSPARTTCVAMLALAAEEPGPEVVGYWGELASSAASTRARELGALGAAGDLFADGSIGSHTAACARTTPTPGTGATATSTPPRCVTTSWPAPRPACRPASTPSATARSSRSSPASTRRRPSGRRRPAARRPAPHRARRDAAARAPRRCSPGSVWSRPSSRRSTGSGAASTACTPSASAPSGRSRLNPYAAMRAAGVAARPRVGLAGHAGGPVGHRPRRRRAPHPRIGSGRGGGVRRPQPRRVVGRPPGCRRRPHAPAHPRRSRCGTGPTLDPSTGLPRLASRPHGPGPPCLDPYRRAPGLPAYTSCRGATACERPPGASGRRRRLVVGQRPVLTGELGDPVHHLVGDLPPGPTRGQARRSRSGAPAPRSGPSPCAPAGTCAPIGCTSSVPTSPTGTIGALAASASQPTPVRPR